MLTNFMQRLTVQAKQGKDARLIPLSDWHTGGSTALFPFYNKGDDLGGFDPHPKMTGENGGWKFKHSTYTPTAKQYTMFQHLKKCAEQIAERRTDERFIIVQSGDATDGDHHKTPQLVTRNISEQNSVHIWLMKFFMHKIGFDKSKGDKLFYGNGTEVHDGDEEDTIAQQLGAEILPNGDDTFDFMEMDINGKLFNFLHQGAAAGRGLSTGNALHNFMKNLYFTCLEDGRRIPDCIISGHYHQDVYDVFTRKDKMMHGIILPPWQLKTRFGYRVAAAELDGVGIRTVFVPEFGDLKVNKPILIRSSTDTVIA